MSYFHCCLVSAAWALSILLLTPVAVQAASCTGPLSLQLHRGQINLCPSATRDISCGSYPTSSFSSSPYQKAKPADRKQGRTYGVYRG